MENDILAQIIAELAALGIDSPRLEARMIIAHVLGVDANSYFSIDNLSAEQLVEIAEIISRRSKHEPLDKILGLKGFYKHQFAVSSDVLSPRPDSEILVEAAVKLAKEHNLKSIIELGVGSGCLILSILADVQKAHGLGIDKSAAAIAMAEINADKLRLSKRISFREADYFEYKPDSKFDMLISNPPYIPSDDIPTLDKEVKDFDPHMALDGGKDGLDHYKKIAEIASEFLKDNAYILLEAGINQAAAIKTIFLQSGLHFVSTEHDLGGIERCIIFKK